MGKSSLKLVLSQLQVVDPTGDQPAYVRSRSSIQKAPRLLWHQRCVKNSFSEGQEFRSREEAREALKAASADCARRNPKPRNKKAIRAKQRWGNGRASSDND